MKHKIIVTHAYAQARVLNGKFDCFNGCKHLKQISKRKARQLLKTRKGGWNNEL